jgi:hypothetical protein
VLLCVLLALTAGVAFVTTLESYFPLGAPGTADYVQYWSAYRALQQGLNPYDGLVLHEIQRSVGQLPDTTTLMWNPPWTCLFLAPFLVLPFSASAALWFLLSLTLLFLISCAALPLFPGQQRLPRSIAVLSCLLFYPVIECLSWGQLSIFITAASALTMCLLQRGHYAAAGISVLPLSLKPHLFFLFAPLMTLMLYRLPKSERRALLLAAALGMLATVIATEALWPGSLGAWVNSFQHTPRGPGAVPAQQWMTATLTTLLRSLLVNSDNTSPAWPLMVVPSATFAVMCAWVFTNRRNISASPNLFLHILCMSLLFGNYGWLYDQSLLVLCQLSVVCTAYKATRALTRGALIGGLVAIFCAAVLCRIYGDPPAQHHYTWIPAAMLLLMWLSQRLTKGHSEPLGQAPHHLYGSPDPS